MTTHENDTTAVTAVPATMTAWRQLAYGGPDAVTATRLDVPRPGRGEVLLRVRATALNSGDIHVMRGEPRAVRLAFGLRRPRVAVRGMDVAGTVVSVGDEVTAFAVGDEVVGELPGGGLAEYVATPAAKLTARPESVDPVTAAALPVAGGTAWLALEKAGITPDSAPGRRVLVIGASGGVGTFTVALAALRGAEVWALAGARSRTAVEGLGATRVLDYREVQPGSDELPDGTFDAVIDIAGEPPLAALQRLVRDGGRIALVGGEGGSILGPMRRILGGALRSIGSTRRFVPVVATTTAALTGELIALAAAGDLAPLIERTWPLSQAGDAIAHVDAGHTLGKVVVVAG
ncbi:NAD(P)-dependent alcohol dehydrogenase [Microbacterium cremeum]|uniref:NAD(P)-dependent alcohol dehydrogenase n=1 Tax=Microbacterium cremeum TaxID=2782169 RepID=UPI0018877DCC|nr:NAD(P)-dependent alcohol dehydrogenase [Microbacterium cremeum]